MKCELCGQELFCEPILGYMGAKVGSKIKCINSKCANYFEPMARQEPAADQPEPERGHGIKLDRDKLPIYTEFLMQFPRAIRLVTMVGDEGTRAPGHVRSGWKGVDDGYHRYANAMARHLLTEAMIATSDMETVRGPDIDLLWQAATVVWNDLARLEHLIKTTPVQRNDWTRAAARDIMREPIRLIKDTDSMPDEVKARPRVYVVEQQPFDYSPAKVFGEPCFMEIQKLAPDAVGAGLTWNSKILQQIRRALTAYVPGIDYVIPTGAPAKLMVTGAVLKERGPNHNILCWDPKTQRYLHYTVVL